MGSRPLAFQSWHRFKEAFSPEFVRHAITESEADARYCLDPFGGSGTTALAAQLLGISSTTVEVNPFLVDVIKAKLASYDTDAVVRDFAAVLRQARKGAVDPADYFSSAPATFIQPGVGGRWLFSREVAAQIAGLLTAIDTLQSESHRRLFRILVGGMLVDVSNVVVSGKGRRYRQEWASREATAFTVGSLFSDRVSVALADSHRFSPRPPVTTRVFHGDARILRVRREHDIAIFSPPYPNSFDYTDVYNVELWMLGYLTTADDNRQLRTSTLTSHVQLSREYVPAPEGSCKLDQTMRSLTRRRSDLWSPRIPDMVGAYFADLLAVLRRVRRALRTGATCWLVVGDSQYGGVKVPTARILKELAGSDGWRVDKTLPFRSMRSSPQHGGRVELPETLLQLSKEGESPERRGPSLPDR